VSDDKPTAADLAAFDLEAWANGAVVAKDTIEVSSRAGLAVQLLDLVKQHEDASKKNTRAAAKRAEVEALAEQIRETAAALEGSWVEVEFRAPTPSERREAFKGYDDDDDEGRIAALLERVGRLRPRGSEEWQTLQAAGWLRIFEVIGSGQFDGLSQKMATLAFTKGVTPGFSQRALSYLETRSSAKS
jgi:hypothetical protein